MKRNMKGRKSKRGYDKAIRRFMYRLMLVQFYFDEYKTI